MKTVGWPKRTVSPKAQKRMQELKPTSRRPQAPEPPNVAPSWAAVEEQAFGKRKK